MIVLHVADQPEREVQRCRLCRVVLVDRRSEMRTLRQRAENEGRLADFIAACLSGEVTLPSWPDGGPVTVDGALSAAYRDPDAVPCIELVEGAP